jgi:N-methylhydantoinase B/oxoprolinase/acetone carboxylase alpha subunit
VCGRFRAAVATGHYLVAISAASVRGTPTMPRRLTTASSNLEGSGSVWTVQIQGQRDDGNACTSSVFNYPGGMGGRASKTGLSATCFPAGVSAVPVEILEAAMPIVFERKELRKNSGGEGAQRGGDGQIIAFCLNTASLGSERVSCRSRQGAGKISRRGPGLTKPVHDQRQAILGFAKANDESR